MNSPKNPLLLCCDWGTTSFRLQLVEADTLRTKAKTTEGEGILKTFRAWTTSGQPESSRLAFYLTPLRDRIASFEHQTGQSLSGVPLILSGMASASVGMCDIAYRKLPLTVDGSNLEVVTMPASPEFPHPFAIVSGACTDADVMRGEETLLVGALANRAIGDEAWLVILPGTHSKHVSIRQGRAVNFATYMTGEFFALLSQHSILVQTVEADGSLEKADHRDSFIGGVRDGVNGNLLHDCFSIRARQLLGHASKSSNFHRLSGLLIGAELKEITAREPAGLWLVSGTELHPFYAAAIRALFPTLPITSCDADEALLRGQRTIALRVGLLQNLLETSSAPVRTD